ncbi:hypothetical protein AA637_05050 [Cyanobacterium sp. HL-69]|uniref:hypothetical protein n=1 Tax=Cyanobacterium sp. HL-69 TaxID=2054282 RepID=UPI000CA2BE9C|nr:hypothetical protein AA637_05050 [Cyanobacterium sp. HL-69]
MLIDLYESYEVILQELSELFCFDFEFVEYGLNFKGQKQKRYKIHQMSFARKQDLDNFIDDDNNSGTDYGRASVLYSLYACGYLEISDIEYPTYKHWKYKHTDMTIDHQLPKKWFPALTFDCTNWKPMNRENNQKKGDDFLHEGVQRLEMLSNRLQDIKSKYL